MLEVMPAQFIFLRQLNFAFAQLRPSPRAGNFQTTKPRKPHDNHHIRAKTVEATLQKNLSLLVSSHQNKINIGSMRIVFLVFFVPQCRSKKWNPHILGRFFDMMALAAMQTFQLWSRGKAGDESLVKLGKCIGARKAVTC